MKSTGPEPDLGDWGHTSVQLIIHIVGPFVIILVAHFVVPVGRMTPPPVQQEAEEERERESSVEVGRVNIENSVPLEGCCGVFPQSPGTGQRANARDQS